MAISVVYMNEPRSLAFAEANKLSSSQAMSDSQALSAGIYAKHSVGRALDGGNSCCRLLQIGVRRPSDQHSPMSV